MNAPAQNLTQALWRALQANALDAAEPLARQLEALAPGEVDTLQLFGTLDLRRERAALARKRLAQARARAPQVASLWLQRGNAATRSRRWAMRSRHPPVFGARSS